MSRPDRVVLVIAAMALAVGLAVAVAVADIATSAPSCGGSPLAARCGTAP